MIASVVILGAGQAGYNAAAALRHGGFGGKVMLVGDEPGVPYQRPPLSKAYLLGKMDADALHFRPSHFFADNHIELIHDAATAIDRQGRSVRLSSGATVTYDHLVLAVGARNRVLPVPGAGLDGVFDLRTLRDADRLSGELQPGRSVVIAGAGFIGMELAASALARGASVHVVELAGRPMARSLSQSMAQVVTTYHQSKGVRFTFGQGLTRVIGTDRAQGVETTSGEILPADCVVIGVGVRPNVELAEAAGLAIENGIKVDAKLLTSDPAISAIGDCASFPILQTGVWTRLESVQNATDQGRAVAARLLGKHSDYEAVPWFWSDQFDMKIQITGLSYGCDETVAIGDPDSRRFSVLCFRDGKLIAVESLNRPADHMAARRLLGRNTVLTPAQVGVESFELPAWEVRTRTEGATPARAPA